ncbi:MAG TPA: caspase family protein [Thermoanaerobaculia bacterium]
MEGRPARAGRRRALLVGINDYSASRLPPAPPGRPPGRRSVPNLSGAVNDVQAMREMLLALYGFAQEDIFVLTDQAATRQAILQAIEQRLIEPSGPGDIAFFYFSGHGSQAMSTRADEPDRKDETIVPADSVRGAWDLRDKELRLLFNRILDRRAHLTIALDSCHSGSGARGLLVGARFRSAEPDPRDLHAGSPAAPPPEDRGALVFSAAQDHELAWETWDEQGQPHGAFSLALVRALRDSVASEPAEETYLRARARLQAEKRYQQPVIAGTPEVRRAPFLGQRSGQLEGRTVVAIESVRRDGTLVLQGGLAHGLTVGSQLRALPPNPGVRIEVTAVHGFSRSDGRILPGSERTALAPLEAGALAEVVNWAALPGAPLRVWMPEAGDDRAAAMLARELAQKAPRQGIRWSEDPTREALTHILRWRGQSWELLTKDRVESLGPATDAASVLAKIERPGREEPALFVQLPAPAALVSAIRLGPDTDNAGVERTGRPEEADYVLVGRLATGGIEYAWLRPGVAETDRRRSSLPVRTAWHLLGARTSRDLEGAVLLLRKIHAWLHLETPSGADSPYELALQQSSGELVAEGGTLVGQDTYVLVLRAREARLPAQVEPRYFYVFVIDSFGNSILLFPPSSVENRFPVSPGAPAEISLAPAGTFRVTEPYGVDTYFLLSSDEQIPNPWVLEWKGVRPRGPRGGTALEELLSITGGTGRSAGPVLTPALWSVERKLVTSVPPDPAPSAKSNP